jgi:hypothetical protein
MTVSLVAEQIFPRFCTEVCLGCGTGTAAERLKNCPVIRLDVFLQLSMEESPATVARSLQKTIDQFVDNDLAQKVRVKRGHAANKEV